MRPVLCVQMCWWRWIHAGPRTVCVSCLPIARYLLRKTLSGDGDDECKNRAGLGVLRGQPGVASSAELMSRLWMSPKVIPGKQSLTPLKLRLMVQSRAPLPDAFAELSSGLGPISALWILQSCHHSVGNRVAFVLSRHLLCWTAEAPRGQGLAVVSPSAPGQALGEKAGWSGPCLQ